MGKIQDKDIKSAADLALEGFPISDLPNDDKIYIASLNKTLADAITSNDLLGPTGPQGVTGVAGSTGIQGVAGSQGATGVAGVTGVAGSTGVAGVTGSKGATGVAGSTGVAGVAGINGATGIQGVTGVAGVNGVTGIAGINGATGLQGTQGVTGVQGSTGIAGVNGATGVAGINGATGIQGNQGLTGVAGLQGTTGVAGATGRDGPTGFQGLTGLNGATGIQGNQGTTGVAGATGRDGPTGFQGLTGLNGATGIQGIAGLGATGVQGSQGTTGVAGATGVQGITGILSSAGFTTQTPTVQKFLTVGSGTYTTPTGCLYIQVEMVGGGGGGGGSSATGGTGGTTTFGTSLLTATGGTGGFSSAYAQAQIGGVGGTATVNSPAIASLALSGAQGGGYQNASYVAGGVGGASPFGGAGVGGISSGAGTGYDSGINALANTGSGGGAGGTSTAGTGGGGGAGGYLKAIITNPSSSYSYTVGTGGTAGTGTYAGGSGGSGAIIVTEFYPNNIVQGVTVTASTAPTTQTFLSGSGTYIRPSGVQYIRVRMAGGGGSGGASGVSGGGLAGNSGNASTFGTSLLTANGGSGGNIGSGGSPSAGGTVTINSPAISLVAVTGGTGGGSGEEGSSGGATAYFAGGSGGSNPLGGSGGGGNAPSGAGVAGAANTGAGGGGSGSNNVYAFSGTGGAAGGYLEAFIANPSSTYAYSVGTGGASVNSGSGGFVSGAGGSGVIIVEEYYTAYATGGFSGGGANVPTVTKLLSGSGTYTPPANCISIQVQMVGGGGGGGGSGTTEAGSNGGNGTNTTFGTSLLVANGGNGGTASTFAPGVGGSGSLGSITTGFVAPGNGGGGASGLNLSGANNYAASGAGGGSAFFGGGGAGASYGGSGIAGAANSGGGGSGGGGTGATTDVAGGVGGGGGGCVSAVINNPSGTYAYTVGTGGTAGAAGTSGFAGAAGGSGAIIITEYYANGTVGTATNVTGIVATANGGTSLTSSGTAGNVLTSNGSTWVSSPISAGSKNYLSAYTASTGSGAGNPGNGNFETGTTSGWSLAHSALTSLIPTSTATAGSAFSSSSGGSAAAGTLSFATISSGQLSGNYSGSLVSTAASTAGDMLVSSAFYVDLEDQAKVMTFKFYYKVASGAANLNFSGTSSNSYAVWVYDVTNAAWIQPAGVYNLTQNSGVGYATGTFQTTSNSTQYQLALVNINASSGASTLYVDDFSVGPQTAPSGPVLMDWNTNLFFTTQGFGTPTQPYFVSRRVGDSLEVEGFFIIGTPTATPMAINLPVSIDSTKFYSSSQVNLVGTFFNPSGSANFDQGFGSCALFYDGSTTNQVFFAIGASSNVYAKYNGNAIFSSGQGIGFRFTIPVAGWSSNSSMSSDTDTRVVAASMYINADQTTVAGNPIKWDGVQYDTHAAYSTSTGLYTAPVAGKYSIYALMENNLSTNYSYSLYVNGTFVQQFCISSLLFGSYYSGNGSATVSLKAGDTVGIYAATGSATSVSARGIVAYGEIVSIFTIARLSGPAVVAATESVNMHYQYSGTGTVPANSFSIVPYDTKAFDSHNAFSTSTNLYTVPVSGKYRVSVKLCVASTLSTTQQMLAQLWKNGVEVEEIAQVTGVGALSSYRASGSTTIMCNAGDTLGIYAQNQGSGVGAGSYSGSTTLNFISIERIGN